MEAIMRYGFHELFLNYLCLTVQIRYTVLYVYRCGQSVTQFTRCRCPFPSSTLSNQPKISLLT